MSEERPVTAKPLDRGAVADVGDGRPGAEAGVEPETTAAPPPVVPRPATTSSIRPPEPSHAQATRLAPDAQKRVARRMTLKIPDDEVARPTASPSTPPAKVAAASAPPEPMQPPITGTRIITIDPPPPETTSSRPPPRPVSVPPPSAVPSIAHVLPPAEAKAPPQPAPPAARLPAPSLVEVHEDSWTPYAPSVAEEGAAARTSTPGNAPAGIVAPRPRAPSFPSSQERDSNDDIPIVTETTTDAQPESGEPLELEDDGMIVGVPPKLGSVPPPPMPPIAPAHPAAPIATPASAMKVIPAVAPVPVTAPPTVARLQTPLPTPAPALAPPVAPAAPAPAGAHASAATPLATATPLAGTPAVAIKDLPPMRAMAPTEPEAEEVRFEDDESSRGSEPGDAAEIAPEDLVSVESVPVPASKHGLKAAAQTAAQPAPPANPAKASPAAARRPQSLPPPPATAVKTPPASAVAARSRVIVPTGQPSPIAPPPMSDAHTGRRRARPWWEELFNDDFIRTMAKISDEQIAAEAGFIEESLAVARGAMLLDLACGTGRHAIELTRRGYKVVGFDLSLPMLARAADEAQERNQRLNFVQGDMREMTFEDTFDGIYCWNTSFGFFEEDKNAQVIARVHKALRKGGQFLLDVVNRDFLIRQAPSLAWFEGEGCICMDEMSIDWITSRMKVKRTMMMDDGRTKEIEYSVRVYSLHELGKVLHDAGFRVAEVSGRTGTPGVFFGNESPRSLILAEKR